MALSIKYILLSVDKCCLNCLFLELFVPIFKLIDGLLVSAITQHFEWLFQHLHNLLEYLLDG